ncbi:MAG: DUF3137 domain-containing protein [Sphingosinicella sp.]
MHRFGEGDFEDLCRAGRVKIEMDSLEDRRRQGVRRFWLIFAASIVLAAILLVGLWSIDWPVAAIVAAIAIVALGLGFGLGPLGATKRALKQPVLATLAEKGGIEYLETGFDPPVFPEASRILFGGISNYSFSDLFWATDGEGKRYAVYEGTLTRRQGKHTITIFTGQFFAFQRRTPGHAEMAVLPDKGLFNFFSPKGMERLKFESDPDFEQKFEVYSDQPSAAMSLVGSDVRRLLLELRQQNKVWTYVGPDDVLVALWGKDRFEPGSMFRSRPARERVRQMFDEVCASLTTLTKLKAAFD